MRSLPKASDIIETLQLKPLDIEGGFYRLTYVSPVTDENKRSVGSSIFYLLTPENFSRLHKHDADELFHFYAGDPVTQLFIDAQGSLVTTPLGHRILDGQRPQCLVPAHCWQSLFYSELNTPRYGWSLVGATVHPAFNELSFCRVDEETRQRHRELSHLF